MQSARNCVSQLTPRSATGSKEPKFLCHLLCFLRLSEPLPNHLIDQYPFVAVQNPIIVSVAELRLKAEFQHPKDTAVDFRQLSEDQLQTEGTRSGPVSHRYSGPMG